MFSTLTRRVYRNVIHQTRLHITKNAYSNVTPFSLMPYQFPVMTQHNLIVYRHKSKKSKKEADLETETTEEHSAWEDLTADKYAKVMVLTVKSPRIDGILKSGLGIARNKIETLFYESKIRVNGQKLLKKSALAEEGDEIDIVKGTDSNNPNFLTVARVEVLSISEKGENIGVKIRRSKSLTIENYDKQSK